MAIAVPPKLLEAIAADAGVGFITNPMPETQPVTPNAASIQLGFPPKTMQNELAGGLPPFGQDMNGFLFLISSHTLWVETGQRYLFDSDIATAIGGYPVGTQLGMADGTGAWLCITANNTNNPDTGGAGWVPIESYGFATVPVTGGTVNLTKAQSKKGVIILTGVLISNLTVNLPVTVQEWLIVNQTSGAFATTVKTAVGGSVGVVIPQGGFGAPTGVYGVGDNNIYPTVAPLGIPIDQNPTPLTLVQRTNAGQVLAQYFNQNSALENPTMSAVFVQASPADGYLRKISLTNFESQLLLQGFGGQVVNAQVPFSAVSQWAAALFTNAALTGIPTAPTAAAGTSTPQIATTAFANPDSNLANPGHAKLPGGLIFRFGTVSAPNVGGLPQDINVVFDQPFPNVCLGVIPISQRSIASNGQAVDGSNFYSNPSVNGCTITVDAGAGGITTAFYLAVGF